MRDIARLAGVSPQTVSRVVNGDSAVKESTRIKVQKIIHEYDYVPNQVARSHFAKYSMTISVIIGDIMNPVFPEFVRGVQDQADLANYRVFVYNTDTDKRKEADCLRVANELAADGVILFVSRTPIEVLAKAAKPYLPIVGVNIPLSASFVGSVGSDNYQGAYDAMVHLIKKGYKDIGFIAPIDEVPDARRYKAYKNALSDFGLPFRQNYVAPIRETEEGGYKGAKALLNKQPNIDALFCYNDIVALGAMDACKELSLNPPEDIAIVGYDDIELSRRCSPALTTVKVDKYQLGVSAFQQFLALRGNELGVVEPIVLKNQLIIRNSS